MVLAEVHLLCLSSKPMFVRPLSAVGSAPAVPAAAVAVWRQCYWRTPSPRNLSRNPWPFPRPFCPFTGTELPGTDHLRRLHLSPGLMKHLDPEPPVKRRRSSECERSGEGVKPASRRSASRERREPGPPWLHDITDVPLPSGKLPPSLDSAPVKTGDDAAEPF